MKAVLIIIFVLTTQVLYGQKRQSKGIKIHGYVAHAKVNDTITLSIWNNYLYEPKMFLMVPHTEMSTVAKDGHFSFALKNINHPVYIFVGHSKTWGYIPYNTIFPTTVAEPGDDIYLSRLDSSINKGINNEVPDDFDVTITGYGAEKYKCYVDILKKKKALANENTKKFMLDQQPTFPTATDTTHVLDYIQYYYNIGDKKFEESLLPIINNYKSKISTAAYLLMKADVIGLFRSGFSSLTAMEAVKYKENPMFLKKLSEFYYRQIKETPLKNKDSRIESSAQYIEYLASQIAINKYWGRNFTDSTFIKAVNIKYKGILRDRILAYYVLSRRVDLGPNTLTRLSIIRDSIKDTVSANIFQNVIKSSVEGSQAFNFKLEDPDGKFVTLSDFKGKIILLDFWYTGCVHCAEYYNDVLSKIEEEYRSDDKVKFITINIDRSKEMWRKSIEKGSNLGLYTSNLATNLHSDKFNKKDTVTRNYNVVEYPHPFLINQAGKIASADQHVLRDYNSLKKAIESLKNKD